MLKSQNILQRKVFKNNSEKGDFGEYLYIKFCKKNNIPVKRLNRFGRDIDLANAKIDVKTSNSLKNWRDKKYKPYVRYDVIFINEANNSVYLYPEKDSPLRKDFYEIKLGEFNYLFNQWKNNPLEKMPRYDAIKEVRNEIQERVSEKFRSRILYRIDTHQWKGYPDNVPGSWEKYDATIFLKIKFDWERDEVGEIQYYLFLSNEMDLYSYEEPTKRQRDKGYEKNINWKKFQKTFSRNIFNDIDKLINYINTKQ